MAGGPMGWPRTRQHMCSTARLYHESDLRIEEHVTDTNGVTDHIFLCPFLGFRCAPGIRDLPDKNLYAPDHPKNYPALTSFIGEKITTKLILV